MEWIGDADRGIYVSRYVGEDGEIVVVSCEDKDELLRALDDLMNNLDRYPVCGDDECLEDTRLMLEDFKHIVNRADDKTIYAEFFVEYI